MSENNNTNSNTIPTFTTDIQGALLVLLTSYHDKYERMYSLQHTIEQALLVGYKAMVRSKEYAEATKKNKAFIAALAKDPTIALDPVRMSALTKKFGIGSSKGGPGGSGLNASGASIEEAEFEVGQTAAEDAA
jgi:hypothetical protein